jgi:hypothetical protein
MNLRDNLFKKNIRILRGWFLIVMLNVAAIDDTTSVHLAI